MVSIVDELIVEIEEKPMKLVLSKSLEVQVSYLESKKPFVLIVDALISRNKNGIEILKYILSKVDSRLSPIKIMSMKFCPFDNNMQDLFIEWVEQNEDLETLYIQESDFEGKSLARLHKAWKKKLYLHRFENNGVTLNRYPFSTPLFPF